MPHRPTKRSRQLPAPRRASLARFGVAAVAVAAALGSAAPEAQAERSDLARELASLQRTLDLIEDRNATPPLRQRSSVRIGRVELGSEQAVPSFRSDEGHRFGLPWPAFERDADPNATRLSFVGDGSLHTFAFLETDGAKAFARASANATASGSGPALVTLDASALSTGADGGQRVRLFASASAGSHRPAGPDLKGVSVVPTPTAAVAGLALLAAGALRRRPREA